MLFILLKFNNNYSIVEIYIKLVKLVNLKFIQVNYFYLHCLLLYIKFKNKNVMINLLIKMKIALICN